MTGIIILAAGASVRMGKPKQLLAYQQKTLVQHAIDTALATDAAQVIVVLGSNAENIIAGTNTAGAEVVVNAHWQEGMASSVRLGISTLQQDYPDVESVFIVLCDQPFVTPELLGKLQTAQEQSGKKIAASFYKQTAGVPVLFHKNFFPELLKLQGQEGAKKLLAVYKDEVVTVPFPQGETDIDTVEDYEQLLQKL